MIIISGIHACLAASYVPSAVGDCLGDLLATNM